MALEGCFDEYLLSVEGCEGVVRGMESDCVSPVAVAIAPYRIMFLCDGGRTSDAISIAHQPIEHSNDRFLSAATEEKGRFFNFAANINRRSHEGVERPYKRRSPTFTAGIDVCHAILCYISGLSLELVYYRHDTNALVIFPVVVGEMV